MSTKPNHPRSSHWPTVRAAHLREHPACEACGTTHPVEVHHRVPFDVDASRELDPTNLITLCESESHNCHLLFGHLLDWHSWNVRVVEDTQLFRERIRNRPHKPTPPAEPATVTDPAAATPTEEHHHARAATDPGSAQ